MHDTPPPKYSWTLARALVGVACLAGGLCFAALSHPKLYPLNVSSDRIIDFYAFSGFGCAVLGMGLFFSAVKHTTAPMSLEQQRETNFAAAAGFLLQLIGSALIAMEVRPSLGWFFLLAGIPVLVWSCSLYAKAKGYSQQIGWLGLLGVIGLMILLILPVKIDQQSSESHQ